MIHYFKIIFPFPFVTGNHGTKFGKGKHYTVKSVKLYRLAVKSQLEKIKNQFPDLKRSLPIKSLLDITVQFYPPDKRRRDKDNCEKIFFDALTKAGFWKDDSLIGDKYIPRWIYGYRQGIAELEFEIKIPGKIHRPPPPRTTPHQEKEKEPSTHIFSCPGLCLCDTTPN